MAKKASVTTLEHIDVAKLWIDSSTQPRVAIDMETVSEYAESMAAGAAFPPVVAYHDGGRYILADGFHRVLAAREAKIATLAVELHEGTIRDAVLYSVAANAEHGLRRTHADKRRAVERLLKDSEWAKWSNAEIARRCRVSPTTVASIRNDSSLSNLDSDRQGAPDANQGAEAAEPKPVAAATRTYTTKHGTKATMNTERIGRSRAGAAIPEVRRVPDPDICQQDSTETAKGPFVETITLPLTSGRELADYLASTCDNEFLDALVTRLLQRLGAADD